MQNDSLYVYSDNMKNDGNSVNMAVVQRGYHHGDLRAALVSAGLELLKDRSVDDLSLREVARTVGVSATAVYRHFPDKQALLYALCEQGAAQLAHAQQEAMAAAGDGKSGFDETGRAYVRFAVANPALFRLMMTTRPPGGLLDADEGAVNAAMRLLRQNIASLLPPGATDDELRMATIKSWALVHGLAMLMLDGQVPADERIIDALTRPFAGEC